MPNSSFALHPIIEAWFRKRFGSPTDPQRLSWPHIAAGRHTLIAAPTGSGKTFSAFLVCIDQLVRQALAGEFRDQVQVVYVSPLKALSNDIKRNLDLPLIEISDAIKAAGYPLPTLRALVRTGDTPMAERTAMLKKVPHIIVTTPESLYLLLTAEKSRALLATTRTVIIDEIHALARDKRGSHLALSLERLDHLCSSAPVRIGLSATQKPIEELACFLVGNNRIKGGKADCEIVDVGHARILDLDIVLPKSDLAAVCSNEQWDEIYQKLSELISTHSSTIVFVNTRRMAERVSHRLREQLGDQAVASHHGSLSRVLRLAAEEQLKAGKLKAIVATASLELGIDVGFIDLVCQIGSPRSIATFLQRIGRSGHHLGVIPKGRLFALTREELIESLAILRSIKNGKLDTVEIPRAPLDILAQQIVAEVAAQEHNEDQLFKIIGGAWPYRDLTREKFNRILHIVSEGIANGRKEGAYLHRDQVNHQLRPRRSARLTALTSGGAIPETGEYRVVNEDDRSVVGSVNEDFAIESLAGDIFLLGNTSWRVRYVRGGQMVVRDAEGAPASVPFWLGEAPARTKELSSEISDLRHEVSQKLDCRDSAAQAWIQAECKVDQSIARQAVNYLAAQKAAVGFLPTKEEILFERFFDESGGMQLVIHAPYGARINRAWGLALRKRFCRTFDFELQASADDNGITLSLGPQHSFPLEQMFTLVSTKHAEKVLIQALLATPMFGVRWRWNATRALAVLRMRAGKKVPPPLQRFRSDDLLTAVFPLQTACFEHRPPEMPIPDHPLIDQTIYDCLHEAMDLAGWKELLTDIESKKIRLIARDTREPSPFSHSILNANPYSFLDDAPLEERRARAVSIRRVLSIEDMRDLAKLDPAAIQRVRNDAALNVRNAEELHDALLSLGALTVSAGERWRDFFVELTAKGRAIQINRPQKPSLWVAAERYSLVRSLIKDGTETPVLSLPEDLMRSCDALEAAVFLIRGRLEISGPVTAQEIAGDLGIESSQVESALMRLESEGAVLQGRFSGKKELEWCARRLLARIHRLTLDGARRAIKPVAPETYWQYLAEYHHLLPGTHREGLIGLREALGQLQGFEMPAGSWEGDVISNRIEKYQAEWLDQISFSGEISWGRLRTPNSLSDTWVGLMTRSVPVSFFFRSDLAWLLPEQVSGQITPSTLPELRSDARTVYKILEDRGALFWQDLAQISAILPSRLSDALRELSALGMISADGFAALRSFLYKRRQKGSPQKVSLPGGRWSLFPGSYAPVTKEERLKKWAQQLIARYGIVFRDILTREPFAPPWWQLVTLYRSMEARGEIRGGRFISDVAAEQYALPEAVQAVRRPRDTEDQWVIISAADPLNLTGILPPGKRLPALRGNRLLFHNGRLAAVLQAGNINIMESLNVERKEKISRALSLSQLPQMRDDLLKELHPQVIIQ